MKPTEEQEPTPEQTLEEKVREILEPLGFTITYVHEDEVSFCNDWHQCWITADRISYNLPNGGNVEKTLSEYVQGNGNYQQQFKSIAALLSESTKPELEQRNKDQRKLVERYQADYLKIKQQYDDQTTDRQRDAEHIVSLRNRIKELESQLQGSVSEEDHEREISQWETAFEAERKTRMDQTRLATQYREWFEEAHAERLALKGAK